MAGGSASTTASSAMCLAAARRRTGRTRAARHGRSGGPPPSPSSRGRGARRAHPSAAPGTLGPRRGSAGRLLGRQLGCRHPVEERLARVEGPQVTSASTHGPAALASDTRVLCRPAAAPQHVHRQLGSPAPATAERALATRVRNSSPSSVRAACPASASRYPPLSRPATCHPGRARRRTVRPPTPAARSPRRVRPCSEPRQRSRRAPWGPGARRPTGGMTKFATFGASGVQVTPGTVDHDPVPASTDQGVVTVPWVHRIARTAVAAVVGALLLGAWGAGPAHAAVPDPVAPAAPATPEGLRPTSRRSPATRWSSPAPTPCARC